MIRAAAADRNKAPILEIFRKYFTSAPQPTTCVSPLILELSSGTGQHVAYLAEHTPEATFQPSEIDRRCIDSISAYIDHHKLKNVRKPIIIDVTQHPHLWPLDVDYSESNVDIILSINMIHISSTAAVDGLFAACNYLLKPAGMLLIYGPFSVDGTITPESNVNFDRSLRADNPDWGLRDTAHVKQLADANRLRFEMIHDMPANNKMIAFRKML